MNPKIRIPNSMSGRGAPLLWFACGAVAGTALTMLLDPAQGASRRGLITGKMTSVKKNSARNMGRMARDLKNRGQGVFATLTHFRSRPVDDDVLNQRLRSQLGHFVDHARSIETSVRDGVVTLSGPVLSSVSEDLIGLISRVEGVKDVINNIKVQRSPEDQSKIIGDANPYLQ